MTEERDELAEGIRRTREAAQAVKVPVRGAEGVLGESRRIRPPGEIAPAGVAPAPVVPTLPDGTAVNQSWDLRPILGRGGLVGRLLRCLLTPFVQAQVTFNSRQVQLDNEVLRYLEDRFEATHRHYDAVLGIHGRHMEEIDERHLQLQEDLVGHVHDLVKRIDLVLEEHERTRVSLEAMLREARTRLAEIETRLAGR
jgi:hypothetical protein